MHSVYAFALTGRLLFPNNLTQGGAALCPGLWAHCPFRAFHCIGEIAGQAHMARANESSATSMLDGYAECSRDKTKSVAGGGVNALPYLETLQGVWFYSLSVLLKNSTLSGP